jgi:hypothetical protein
MHRSFGLTMVVVLVLGFGLSLVAADPHCTEGPCGDDVLQVLTVVVLGLIALVWLVAAGAAEARDARREADRKRRERGG